MKWSYVFAFLLAALYTPVISAGLSRSSSPIASTVSLKSLNTATMVAEENKHVEGGVQLPKAVKLLIGAGGIYASFLYYGALQEDVFHFKAADGTMFKQAWFLQALGKLIAIRSFFLCPMDLIFACLLAAVV